MTPKEKAEYIFLKFRQIPPSSPYTGIDDGEAKQAALVAVDLILETECLDNIMSSWYNIVKEEIKKL